MILVTDGGLNKGCMLVGYLLLAEDGSVVDSGAKQYSEGTSNMAEILAILFALLSVRERWSQISFLYSDSQLIVRQLTFRYKCKSRHLKPMIAAGRAFLRESGIGIRWHKRSTDSAIKVDSFIRDFAKHCPDTVE